MNICRFCGSECEFKTCNQSCKTKLWFKENPERAKEKVRKLQAAHLAATKKRWVARMRELIPDSIFTKEQEIIIAKALAAQNRSAYMRGYNRGRWQAVEVERKGSSRK